MIALTFGTCYYFTSQQILQQMNSNHYYTDVTIDL